MTSQSSAHAFHYNKFSHCWSSVLWSRSQSLASQDSRSKVRAAVRRNEFYYAGTGLSRSAHKLQLRRSLPRSGRKQATRKLSRHTDRLRRSLTYSPATIPSVEEQRIPSLGKRQIRWGLLDVLKRHAACCTLSTKTDMGLSDVPAERPASTDNISEVTGAKAPQSVRERFSLAARRSGEMKVSRMLLVVFLVSHATLGEGFSFSVALVSLGVAGLTGLKLYFGMKMFAPGFRRGRNEHVLHKPVPDPNNQKFEFALNISLPDPPKHGHHHDPPMAYESEGGSNSPVAGKVRRDVTGSIKLSEGFLRWLKSIDDEKCIHRFFCELGTDQSNFGNLGRLTNILISMGGLPRSSWAQDMFEAGQDGKPCPKTCDEHELSKTVTYLERHLFAPTPPDVDSAIKTNEISD